MPKVSQLFFEQSMQSFGIGAGDLVRRVIWVRESQFGRDVPTAPEAWSRRRFVELVEDRQNPLPRVASSRVERGSVAPFVLSSGFEEGGRDEFVFATEVLVQGPSRHRGIFEDGINTDSHPLDGGESLGGCQEALPGSGFGGGAHGVTFYRRA